VVTGVIYPNVIEGDVFLQIVEGIVPIQDIKGTVTTGVQHHTVQVEHQGPIVEV
jgi:hypothetical protein